MKKNKWIALLMSVLMSISFFTIGVVAAEDSALAVVDEALIIEEISLEEMEAILKEEGAEETTVIIEEPVEIDAVAEEDDSNEDVSAEYETLLSEVTNAPVSEAQESLDCDIPPVLDGDIGDHVLYERESNNYTYNADRIYNDYTVSGSLTSYDVDMFKFTLSSRSKVEILCQAAKRGHVVSIFDSTGEDCLAVGTDLGYDDGYYYDSLKYTLASGTYYVVVLNSDAYTGSYLFYFTYTATAHTHSYTSRVTAPTCTAQGYTTYTCSCGYSYTGNTVAAKGHTTTLKNKVDATCTTSGYTGDLCCTVCGVTTSTGTVVAAKGHSYGEWYEISGTRMRRDCQNCDKYETKTVESSHTPGDITGDGVVNNKDLNRLMKYLTDNSVEVVDAALDVNGDGSVNNKDLNRLMKYLSDNTVEIH